MKRGMRVLLRLASVALAGVVAGATAQAGTWTELSGFGSNPGALKGYTYVPDGLRGPAPLVVVLHGCKQRAQDYATHAGWTSYADRHGFVLLAPEQQVGDGPIWWFFGYPAMVGSGRNHRDRCFNFAELRDSQRDGDGEAASIRQMIAGVQTQHPIDPKRVHVTGLSAGGGMTAVMLATHPELFAGGAIIAGVPYRCSEHTLDAWYTCGIRIPVDPRDRAPGEWGDFVRAASRHGGPWPTVSIWQGERDETVRPKNEVELLEQWTDVHDIDRTAEREETSGNALHRQYADSQGRVVVETWSIRGMGHLTPIDPDGVPGCGKTGNEWIRDVDVCSTDRIARFWGLIPPGM